MNNLVYTSYNSWSNLLTYAAIIILVLWLLKLINQVSIKYRQEGIIWKPRFLMDLAFNLRLILEPLFMISFVGLFITINLYIHSVIVLVMIALLFPYLNSYFIGKFYIMKGKLQVGNKIGVGEITGQIVSFNLFGLELREGDNMNYILYNQVIKDGFKTLPNHTSIIEVNLKLKMNDSMKDPNWIKDFKLFLFDIPYINISVNPIISADYQKEIVELKLMLNEGVKEKYITEIFIDNGFELIH